MPAKPCLGKVLNQELRQGQDFVTGLFSWPAFQAIFCGRTTPFRPSLTTTPTRFVAPSDALGEGLGVSIQTSVISRNANEFYYRYVSQFNTYAGESPSTSWLLKTLFYNQGKITTDSWVLETVQGLHLHFTNFPVQINFLQEASLSEEDRSPVTLEIQKCFKMSPPLLPLTGTQEQSPCSSGFI